MRQQLARVSPLSGVGLFACNARLPCTLTHGAQAQGEAHVRPLESVLVDFALTCYRLAPPSPPWPWEGRHRAAHSRTGFSLFPFAEYCGGSRESCPEKTGSVFCLLVFPNTADSLSSYIIHF